MTQLERHALARLPLSKETVESFYLGSRTDAAACLHALCESHERLRAELAGTEWLVRDLTSKLSLVLALTDTGSPEFREAFPPRSASEGIDPRCIVPGWRVVEKIREALL